MVSIDYSLILVILNFIVLVWLLNKFIFQNVRKYLEKRQEKIARELKETEVARIKAQELVSQKEKELKEADFEIKEEKRRIIDKAEGQANQILNEAKSREKQILQETKKELLLQKDGVISDISDQVVALVAKVSEKVIAQRLDKDADAQLIKKLIAKGI